MEHYTPRSNIIFDDINFADYNAFAFGCDNLFDRPERDVDIVSVPGRSGDLVLDNGRYKNVDRAYQVQVNGIKNIEGLLSKLSSKVGYFTLEDEYDSEVFFKARLKSRPQVNRFVGDSASITVTFDRHPQRYLKSDINNAVYATNFDGYTYIDQEDPNKSWSGLSKAVIINNTTETYAPLIETYSRMEEYWAQFPEVHQFNIRKLDHEVDYIERGGELEPNYNSTKGIEVYSGGLLFRLDCETGKTYFEDKSTIIPPYMAVKTDGLPLIEPGTNYFYFILDYGSPVNPEGYTPRFNDFVARIYPRRWIL